jgi:hypothetical protein
LSIDHRTDLSAKDWSAAVPKPVSIAEPLLRPRCLVRALGFSSGGASIGVVEGLEMVEVGERDTDGLAVAAGVAQHLREPSR